MTLFFGDSTSDKPYLDGSGRPMVGAVLTFFLSGTTVPAPVYDADGFEVEPPFVADENGVIQDLYLDPELTYRVRMHDALGRLVWDVDPYLTDSPLFRSPVYHAVVEGRPVPGARLRFFRVGTAIPKDIYADGREITRHPNPIRADAGGHFPPIYLQGVVVPNDVYEVVPDFEDEYTFPPIEPRIVIVGNTAQEAEDRIGRSVDGDEWETAESAPMGDWNAAAYAPEIDVFVAVGDDNSIIRSEDGGRTWEACDVPEIESPRDDWVKVTWVPGAGPNAGRFVAGQLFSSQAGGSSFLYSDDGGATWNTASGLSVTFQTRQFAVSPAGVLLAGGAFDTSANNIVKSLDGGATWSGPFSIPEGTAVNGAVYSPSRDHFVCVNQAAAPLFFSSESGESWGAVASTTPPTGNARFLHEVPELNLFTFASSDGLFTSPDIGVWTNRLSVANYSTLASAYARQAGVLIAVGGNQSTGPSIFWSEDGEAWNAASSPPGSETWNGLAVGMEIVPQPGFPIPEAPVITSIDPVSAEINSGAFVLTVHGEKFKDDAVVLWDGNERDTTFVSDTELTAQILATDIEALAQIDVTVEWRDFVSNSETFTVTAPPASSPVWLSVTPTSVTTSGGGNDTDHIIDMPDEVDTGDLLVCCFGNDGATREVGIPDDWNFLGDGRGSPSGSVKGTWFYKVADGDEGGGTILVTTDENELAVAQVTRVQAGTFGLPEIAVAEASSSNAPNPPELEPSGGEQSYLWLVQFVHEIRQTSEPSYPYPDGNLMTINPNGAAGNSATIASCYVEEEADSLDPPAFTGTSFGWWIAATIAIPPA